MSIIESGRIVKVEVMLNVPVDLPVDPRAWALASITVSLAAAREVRSVNAFVGTVTPTTDLSV